MKFRKEEEKPSSLAGNQTVYVENPKEFIKQLLELIQDTRSVSKNQFCFYALTTNFCSSKTPLRIEIAKTCLGKKYLQNIYLTKS